MSDEEGLKDRKLEEWWEEAERQEAGQVMRRGWKTGSWRSATLDDLVVNISKGVLGNDYDSYDYDEVRPQTSQSDFSYGTNDNAC